MIEQDEENNELFPIRTVSNITGVNSVTLRAWERRYELLSPTRTLSGHRLYKQEDVDRIFKTLALIKKGISICQAAQIVTHKINLQEHFDENTWDAYQENILAAVMLFDENMLERVYQQALSQHPIQTVTRKLIIPSLQELGIRWQYAVGAIAEEHFFSAFLRNKLGARFHHRSHFNTGPKLLIACLPGEHHEIGLLLFALAADERNYQQVLLGSDMPLAELPIAVERSNADAIVLSGRHECQNIILNKDLPALIKKVKVPVFIGGQVCLHQSNKFKKIGIIPLTNDIESGLKILANHFEHTEQIGKVSQEEANFVTV